MLTLPPFLRAALFCEVVDRTTEGRWSLSKLVDFFDLRDPNPAKLRGNALPVYIEIVNLVVGQAYVVRLRFIDEQDRYLPAPLADPLVFKFPPAPTNDGIRLTAEMLIPGTTGAFRLLVELNGRVIGWAPLRVFATVTSEKLES